MTHEKPFHNIKPVVYKGHAKSLKCDIMKCRAFYMPSYEIRLVWEYVNAAITLRCWEKQSPREGGLGQLPLELWSGLFAIRMQSTLQYHLKQLARTLPVK